MFLSVQAVRGKRQIISTRRPTDVSFEVAVVEDDQELSSEKGSALLEDETHA
jgi:hypothetical protein